MPWLGRRHRGGPGGYDAPVNERSAPGGGAIACPFVALEHDRDGRSVRPDHRHRCYAESVPAPRALAHQQHYCLSTAYPACPTFGDWAQREAARVVEADVAAPYGAGAAAPYESGAAAPSGSGAPAPYELLDEPRAAARSWAAPPPWMQAGPAGDEQLGAFDRDASAEEPPARVSPAEAAPRADAGRVVEASAREAADAAVYDVDQSAPAGVDSPPQEPDAGHLPPFLAGRAGRTVPGAEPQAGEAVSRPRRVAPADAAATAHRDVHPARPAAQARPVLSPRPGGREVPAPAWERPRRIEAYPTLRTRVGLPEIPRLGLAAIALVVAAAVLFVLPTFLAGTPSVPPSTTEPSASAPAVATGTPPPATPAAPTPLVYTVVANDTLSGIATKFGVKVSQILAANPQIKNPNQIAIGDQITIPPKPTPVSVAPGSSQAPAGGTSLP